MKSVVVTGVSTGIGWGALKVLTQAGFHVFGSVRKQADAERLKQEFGDSFTPLLFDVTDAAAVKRGAELVKMSKRAGDFVSLKELVGEVGADACRFFFAMHSPNSHMTFDLELAKKQSNDNPVFYVQYVHARICSIFNNAASKGVDPARGFDASKIVPNAEERGLLLKLLWLEKVLETCVRDSSPHHLTVYLSELSAMFHSFYDKHKVLDAAEPETTAFRLFVLKGVKHIIARGLFLLGVSAPEQM